MSFQNQINTKGEDYQLTNIGGQSVHGGKNVICDACLDRFGVIIMVCFFKTFAEIITPVEGNYYLKVSQTFLYFGAQAACTFHAGCIPSLNPW